MGKVKNLKAEQKLRKQINKAAATYLCDQDEGDLYDAYVKLLEASDDGKGDDQADDFVTVWEPLSSRTSVDEMIRLIEDSIDDDMPELYKNIDWEDLKGQKRILLEVINKDELNPEEKEGLEGILSLIDSIQEDAVDNFGVDENSVFDLHPDEE